MKALDSTQECLFCFNNLCRNTTCLRLANQSDLSINTNESFFTLSPSKRCHSSIILSSSRNCKRSNSIASKKSTMFSPYVIDNSSDDDDVYDMQWVPISQEMRDASIQSTRPLFIANPDESPIPIGKTLNSVKISISHLDLNASLNLNMNQPEVQSNVEINRVDSKFENDFDLKTKPKFVFSDYNSSDSDSDTGEIIRKQKSARYLRPKLKKIVSVTSIHSAIQSESSHIIPLLNSLDYEAKSDNESSPTERFSFQSPSSTADFELPAIADMAFDPLDASIADSNIDGTSEHLYTSSTLNDDDVDTVTQNSYVNLQKSITIDSNSKYSDNSDTLNYYDDTFPISPLPLDRFPTRRSSRISFQGFLNASKLIDDAPLMIRNRSSESTYSSVSKSLASRRNTENVEKRKSFGCNKRNSSYLSFFSNKKPLEQTIYDPVHCAYINFKANQKKSDTAFGRVKTFLKSKSNSESPKSCVIQSTTSSIFALPRRTQTTKETSSKSTDYNTFSRLYSKSSKLKSMLHIHEPELTIDQELLSTFTSETTPALSYQVPLSEVMEFRDNNDLPIVQFSHSIDSSAKVFAKKVSKTFKRFGINTH
ncbi:hypothetical protein BC833DRAFT_611761 [Globomyces pollinis-pini]|nr:hypothetical protein BC833DRAFT_611761 [Globomyces pollinis-pini]